MAQLLAHQGATLALVDVSQPELVEGVPSASYSAFADVTDEEAVQNVAHEAVKCLGATDAVI